MTVADLLRDSSYAGGVGFCYEIDPWLFRDRSADHRPLVVVWDSNVVIYFLKYGRQIVDGEEIDGVDDGLNDELTALGVLLNWWFVRDIRFVVVPALTDDEKRPASSTDRSRRHDAIDAIADALTFQTERWGQPDLRALLRAEVDRLHQLLSDPMKDLLAAFPARIRDGEIMRDAVLCGADVLLTCDRKFIRRGSTMLTSMTKVMSPTDLMDRLLAFGMHQFWSGGILDHPDCPFASAEVIAGDLGKISLLLAAIGDGD